jgi:uncharacterized RDD family membrane protein YckC
MSTSISKRTKDVSIEVMTYAPFSSRVVARIIDMAIVALLWFAFTKLLILELKHLQSSQYLMDNFIDGIEGGVIVFYCIFYMPLLEYFGGTIGKRIMGIHLLDAGNLERPDFMNCFGRGLVYLVFCAMLGIPAVLSCIAVLFSAKKQTWHDLVSNVVAVKKIKL